MADFDQEPVEKIREVVLDAIAALRIVKHCTDNSNTMVAGNLLGLDIDGRLEVTYSFAFPQSKADNEPSEPFDDLDGQIYQMEMMTKLRDVNIDNNCVGWYQSMTMGTIFNLDVVNYQYSYQSAEDLSENSIVIFYDSALSRKGDMVLKAFRLSEKFMELKRSKITQLLRPSEILEELPLTIRTTGYMSAYLRCLQDTHAKEIDCDFDPLNMANTDSFLEKHVETMGNWLDDALTQQAAFQTHAKNNSKLRQEQMRWLTRRLEDNMEKRDQGERELSIRLEDSGLKPLPELGNRTEHLLILGQLDRYCQQVNEHVGSSIQKLTLTQELNKTPV